MAVKRTTYADTELLWAERQLESWKAYIDANPLHELKDRIKNRETKTGGIVPMVVASIEQQLKSIQETMKNYLLLLREVEAMREKQAAKTATPRGGNALSPLETGDIK